ncbi:MAG: tetratricopeptide repeat protein [Candidatus Thorarchaeota archaeon]
MSHQNQTPLTKAEDYFDAGKYDEAMELLNNLDQIENIDFTQKCYYQFLKGLILVYQYKSREVAKLGEEIYKEGHDHNNNLQSLDGLFFIGLGSIMEYNFDKAVEIIKQSEKLLDLTSHISKKDFILRKVHVKVSKAWVNLELGNIDLAEKCLEWSLDSLKELDKTFEIVWVNIIMARVMFQGKNQFDVAIEYTNKALALAEHIKFNHFWIAFCNLSLGVIYALNGEFNISLKHTLESLKLFRETNNTSYISMIYNNLGSTYYYIGDYENALKCLEESLILSEDKPTGVVSPLGNLFEVALEMNDMDLAKKYFNRLESMYNKQEGELIHLIYPYCKALMLKRSSRIRDKAKAEELLKELINAKTIWFEITQNAIIYLCDLLLSEFCINNDSDVLDELNYYINKLLSIAEKQRSYLVFCETFILQAKLFLINFDIKSARRFLTQAQKIAESYGIKRLAMKISYEHDELLKQLKMWEKLKESKASFTERIKLAHLNEQMESIRKKRMAEVPELSDEEPVFLLIVSEGGVPFFSRSFTEDKDIEDYLFGGFFTTINSFINEKFSEGLDRASFGKYTLLMCSASPFLMFYVYKGQSYLAQNRINSFINELKNRKEIWTTFEKFYQINQKINENDVPFLEPLIREIFINKNLAPA